MNQPPVNISPRPSSHGSSHSNQSGSNVSTKTWSKGQNDICVGEEVKIAVDIAMERFRLSEEQKGLSNNWAGRNISLQFFKLLLVPFSYLWSVHRVFNLHALRSCASSIFTCFSFVSFLITSLHLSFALPIFRCPPTSIFPSLHLLQSFSPHALTISVSLLLFSDLCFPLPPSLFLYSSWGELITLLVTDRFIRPIFASLLCRLCLLSMADMNRQGVYTIDKRLRCLILLNAKRTAAQTAMQL